MRSLMRQMLTELKLTKFERARVMIKPMIINGRFTPTEIMERMMRNLDIMDSTADTYYHMIAKELNLGDDIVDGEEIDYAEEEDLRPEGADEEDPFVATGEEEGLPTEDELEPDQFMVQDEPDRAGVVRRVQNAHLVYKRENDAGLYDELWIYNTEQSIGSGMNIKKDILSATDIPPRATTSEDGSQQFTLTVLGDVSFLHITNLPQ